MIDQWVRSIIARKFVCEMSDARDIIERLITNCQVEMQDLKRLSSFCCEGFLHDPMHL
jgi:hypothetical protein